MSISVSNIPSGQTEPPKSRRASPGRHRLGFWLVAGAFFVLMAAGTTPTPLWPLYAAGEGWSTTQVTVAFSIVAAGAATALLLLGHLSDRFGRRRVIVPALACGLVANTAMAVWHQYPVIIAGRVLIGMGLGLMASTATTYLADLSYGSGRQPAPSPGPATIASLANLGGLSVGPLAGGALAQWGPSDPLTTPYVVFAILLAVGLVAVLSSPETVDPTKSSVTVRFRLVQGRAPVFAAAGVVAFCTFAVFGIFSSLGSLMVHRDLHISAPFTWGIAAFMTLGSSALVQVLVAGWTPQRMLKTGICFLPAGLAVVVQAVHSPSLAVYLVGASAAGVGAGLLFKAALSMAFSAADPGARAGTLSVFFVVAYLGMGIPPVVLAAAENIWTPTVCLIVFGGTAVGASALASMVALRHLKRAD